MIHETGAAWAKQMIAHELGALPHHHPSLTEIWTYPAEAWAGRIAAQQ